MANHQRTIKERKEVSMRQKDVERLKDLELRITEIAKENGLLTTDVLFEIVSPQKMIESMAYRFPVNFSHWSFGRDYDRQRTIYDHTGTGIPYETVWDFKHPRAYLVDTNPFALNVLIMAHVLGHVDFFLGSSIIKHVHDDMDIYHEAAEARKRFMRYTEKYGQEAVERIIGAGLSIQWLQDPDLLAKDIPEKELRDYLVKLERAKLEKTKDPARFLRDKKRLQEEIEKIEERIKELKTKTPPRPEPDLLKYIINNSPKPLKDWEKDTLSVIRMQARYFAPQRRTKLLNEGWATYWHVKIMRQLFKEKLLDDTEHGIFVNFHRKVLRQQRVSLNWYRTGFNLFNYIEDRWNKGRFGIKYDKSEDPEKYDKWDTGAMKGKEKIFEVRSAYTDRMAIQEFFSNDFIRKEELYIWQERPNPATGQMEYVIAEKRPEVIRKILINQHTLYGTPLIYVEDGNNSNNKELYLRHHNTGFELDPKLENGTMEYIYSLWGKPVYLETFELNENIMGRQISKEILHSYNGKRHEIID